MGLAFVACTKIESSTGTTASATVATTAGNLLILPCGAYESGGTAATLSGSGAGTWTSDTSSTTIPASGTDKLSGAILSDPNNSGGSNTITITRSAGTGGCVGACYEFSSGATSSPKDANSPAVATGTSASATTNTESNVTANAVFVAMVVDDNGGNPSTLTGTSTGWNYPANGTETNGSTFFPFSSGYKIVTTTTTESSNWTITSSKWGALIAVYKAASAAAFVWSPDIEPPRRVDRLQVLPKG